MSTRLDPALLDGLGPELRAAVEAQAEALAAERAARLHLDAENADLRARNAELAALNARLEHLARELRRARFGPSSEKLSPEQLELAFEDVETAISEVQEARGAGGADVTGRGSHDVRSRSAARTRALPKDLPREERVIEPDDLRCPCGCGDMVRIGEDRSERLDVIPARFRVLVTVGRQPSWPGPTTLMAGLLVAASGDRAVQAAPSWLSAGVVGGATASGRCRVAAVRRR